MTPSTRSFESRLLQVRTLPPITRLERSIASFAGSNPYGLFQTRDENFSVSHLARLSRINNGFDDLVNKIIRHSDFYFCLGQEIYDVLRTAVKFSMPALPAESLDFSDRHTGHADFRQCIPDIIQAKRLNDCAY